MPIITDAKRVETPSAMKQVSLLIGEGFYELLMELPDEFYHEFYLAPIEERAAAWQKMLHEINAGTYDPIKLAHSISLTPNE